VSRYTFILKLILCEQQKPPNNYKATATHQQQPPRIAQITRQEKKKSMKIFTEPAFFHFFPCFLLLNSLASTES
jgi:hypothetical protein